MRLQLSNGASDVAGVSNWIGWLTRLGLSLVVATSIVGVARGVDSIPADESDQLHSPTHRQVRLIEPKLDGTEVKLHTIGMTPEGHLLAGVSGPSNAVLMLDADGETLATWSLELTPTAVTAAPDGTIYVGGSGQIARLGADGQVDTVIDSPHVGDLEALKEKAKESIRASRARLGDIYERQIDMLRERMATIEEKEAEDRSKLEQAQLKAYERQVESLQRYTAPADEMEVPEAQINAAVQRSLGVTSMAASAEDLFICAYDPGQSGYAVWRVGRDLDVTDSKLVMQGLRGCCGQMDIQCCKGKLLVSENTKFKLGIYDRDGQPETDFGARDRTSRAGFGGCCNPMNSLPMQDGTILTAESSIGHIKRFDQDGNLVDYIGKAAIGGGCKHCALAYSEKDDLYFMMYQDKNAICVLANNELTPLTAAEKALEQRTTDFLARASGTWKIDSQQQEQSSGGGILSLFSSSRSQSSHPIAAFRLEPGGQLEILDGVYKVYSDGAEFELLPNESESEAIPFALTRDQVRFFEGTWSFESDGVATLSLTRAPATKFRRDATADQCGGANCDHPNCADKDCPQHAQTAGKAVPALSAESEAVANESAGR